MSEFSANKKLEAVLMDIKEQLNELDREEVLHYMKSFPREIDYNLVQYGNMLIYYEDIRNMYLAAGYSAKNWSNQKVWDTYKRQVGYVARLIYGNYNTGVGAVNESIKVAGLSLTYRYDELVSEFAEMAKKLFEDGDAEDLYEAIADTINDQLIYYDDQGLVAAEYQRRNGMPEGAWEMFEEDILKEIGD